MKEGRYQGYSIILMIPRKNTQFLKNFQSYVVENIKLVASERRSSSIGLFPKLYGKVYIFFSLDLLFMPTN